MEDSRKHPDLFSPEEAAAYLHLESERQLENLRKNYGLAGYPGVGKGLMYWREDLNNVALRIVGRAPVSAGATPKLRMAR